MSVSLLKSPQQLAFIGNELYFEFACDTPDQFSIDVFVGGEVKSFAYIPFGSAAPYRTSVSFTDVISPWFKSFAVSSGEAVIAPVDDFILDYSIWSGEEVLFRGKALRGGISKEAQRTLAANGLDMFIYRLQNTDGLFLFTNRTNDRVLKVREKELYPFVFLHPGVPVSFTDESGNRIDSGSMDAGTVCSLDVLFLLQQFSEQYGSVPRTIEVLCNDNVAFTIAVQPSSRSEEVYHILFRNSLGAFEKLEVTGVASHQPAIGEENAWESLTENNFYETHRDRLSIRDVIEVESGYHSRDDQTFILDAVISDESYFIYPDGSSFRCNITAENPSYRHRMVTPNSIPLKVTAITEDRYTNPMLLLSELDKFRMFNDMFNEMFN